MPELPEVQTVVDDLKQVIVGKKITNFILLSPKTLTTKLINFRRQIIGQKVVDVKRRAKIILIILPKVVIAIHLKMTGQLVIQTPKKILSGGHPQKPDNLPNKYTRAIFFFNSIKLYFNDLRRFGWIKFLTESELQLLDSNFGPEPLDKSFSLEYFYLILNKNSRLPIKSLLTNQKLISGIGNIYADESLFYAGIHPTRKSSDINKEEVRKLYRSIRRVLKMAIKYRGTSFRDYLDGQGKKGNFVSRLAVYGREGQACRSCANLIRKIKFRGRGTHFCPFCQK